MKTKLLLLSFLLTSAIGFSQVVADQVDDFEDGTVQGWQISQFGTPPNQATNIPDGGPNGAGDNFLSYTTTGAPGGEGSKVLVFNQSSHWTGNFTTANIVAIKFDVKVEINNVNLRVAFEGGGNQIVTTNSVPVVAGTGWTSVTIPVSASDFTLLVGSDIPSVLASVSTIRILSNNNPVWVGEARAVTLQLDNIIPSTTLSINEQNLNSDFKILQNPSKSKMTLSLPSLSSAVKLDVFDVLGKKIMSKELNSLTSYIDVSKWNSGVYLVRVTTDLGTQTKRFLKQ